jgi:hypothetical protein
VAATWTSLGVRSVRSQQAATEAGPAPTDASGGIGLSLTEVAGITFWLDAGEGQTISADVGQVDVYQHDGGLWGDAPLLVLPVPPGSATRRRVQLGTVRVENPRGRLAPIANGLSVSGSSVTIDALVTVHRPVGMGIA